ncbi:lysophospholipid acyltransferase family protein [Chondromyces crocatus]|uniref:Phospholipid/glycerol acyltransferase domain-containing protein n=1 Tax=Chondromyces crocatus TaxID=52 RepID=A0A0K1EJP1_CHOCO|nr:lysophospholipid acyltransferase family protein [Chondromyces crocatus]AKT41064.1 uncharacterized protein CMC5_052230 [Chondromyces crocatus]
MSESDQRNDQDTASSLPSVDERDGNGGLVAGYDLEEEIATAVAPIGPTEPSRDALLHFDGPSSAPGDEAAQSSRIQRAPASPEELERQILELEARLDQMMREGKSASTPAPAPSPKVPAPSPKAPAPSPKVPAPPPSARNAVPRPEPQPAATETASEPGDAGDGGTTEILSSDYYHRQWGRDGMRRRAEEVDEFGFDPHYEERYMPLFNFLYRNYFRVEVDGIHNIPAEGRCIVVSNHSGGPIPYDGLMLRTAVRREHPSQRELRWLAEDFVYYLPFAGTIMNRLGAVRACQENAERLLSAGKLVAVFPEGVKGIGKLYRDRYKLQRFGRGGFIRLCLRTRTPLIPCAIVGAEEANPLLHRVEHLTRALGLPYIPITPTFPALGPLGLVPAPTKWRMHFGEKLHFDEYGPEAADDEILVARLSERVRATIQGLLDQTLSERKSVWFG